MWRPPRPSASTAIAPSLVKRSAGVCFVFVRFDPVRSALPPSSSGNASVSASSTIWLALRLATVSALPWAATAAARTTSLQRAGSSPAIRRVYSAASAGCAAA
jgi:hypothetical protein